MTLSNYIARIQPFLLVLTLFFIPLSTSLKSIFLPLALLTILFDKHCHPYLRRALTQTTSVFIFLFAFWIIISSFWSPALWADKASMLSKMLKILYIPILAAGFYQARTRIWALHAFLLSMLITTVVSFYKYLQSYHNLSIDPGDVFLDHIMTGLMIAIAAWLSASMAMRSKGSRRIIYSVAALLFSLQILFINTGRTGHIIYFVLAAFFIFQHVNWKLILISCAILPVILSIGFYSPIFSSRIHSLVNEVALYQNGEKNTSVGFRLQFHQYAYSLFLQKPFIGHGNGGFAWNFAKDNPIPAWGKRLYEPHSQYWLTVVDQGIIGLFLLSGFFISLFVLAWTLQSTRTPILMCLIALYAANLTDSLLLYSSTGCLLLMFAGIGLAEHIENSSIKKAVKDHLHTPLLEHFI